jgi:hypothetical protein
MATEKIPFNTSISDFMVKEFYHYMNLMRAEHVNKCDVKKVTLIYPEDATQRDRYLQPCHTDTTLLKP